MSALGKTPSEEVSMWDREEALGLVSMLEAHLSPKFHIALAGSVLTRGTSAHDVDILIFPHVSTPEWPLPSQCELSTIHRHLLSFGMVLFVPQRDVVGCWRKKGSLDCKFVDIWKYGKKRVDIFYPWLNQCLDCDVCNLPAGEKR